MLQKSFGIVLHSIKYNDVSNIVDIYTERSGRASFLVKLPLVMVGLVAKIANVIAITLVTISIIVGKIKWAFEGLSSLGIIVVRETEIIIAFQYDGNEDEYLEDGTSKFEQDYFSWVIIYKYVDNKLDELLNYECA